MFNFSKENVIFNKGDRIAQLIIEKIVPTKVVSVGEYEELNDTKSGNSGFGSRGLNSFN